MKASDLFELPANFLFAEHFDPQSAPWQWVKAIAPALEATDLTSLSSALDPSQIPSGVEVKGDVFIHETVQLPHFATIEGPAYIGANTQIRPGAYIRGKVIIGENCVIGNACEYKNCLLLNKVQTPHYNYVGDSILGNNAHLGAGVILANLRIDQAEVPVHPPSGRQNSGLRKLGALIGDAAEVGCNSVLQPGTILGKRAVVMPLSAISGHLEANQMAFARQDTKRIARLD